MKLLTVDTIFEAEKKLFDRVKTIPKKIETVDALSPDICGRILAKDIFCDENIPCFRRSTVDGYAVISADTSGSGESIPVFLKLAGAVLMGKSADFQITRGECAYVPTGGMLPVGADAVVMVEYTQLAGGYVGIFEAAAPGAGMVDEGEDLRKGRLFCAGTIIRPQETGALAAAGITSVPVFAPLEISIVSTGDELIPPENKPKPGEARDVNSFSLKALAARRGYRVKRSCAIADNEEAIGKLIVEGMKDCDIVFISGGSSQGEKDLTASVIDSVSAPGVFTHGLAIKPGKPTILGWDEKTKTLLVGLPGHPVSAMMVFETLFGRLQEKIFEVKETHDFSVPAEMACNVPGSPGKTTLLPIMLRASQTTAGGVTGYVAEPVFGKSGMIVTLARASGYVVIDLNKEGLKKGEQVFVHLI